MMSHSMAERFRMTLWSFAVRTIFIAGVVLVSFLLDLSILTALLVVSGAVFLFSALAIWFPADNTGRARPGQEPAGDRSPLRPLPFRPSASIERPLP